MNNGSTDSGIDTWKKKSPQEEYAVCTGIYKGINKVISQRVEGYFLLDSVVRKGQSKYSHWS